MSDRKSAGRPRTFDESDVLEKAVDVFWTSGATNTTTRMLERELGLRQSSIYNAFESKEALLHQSLDRYLGRVEAALLTPLDRPDAGVDELVEFVDQLLDWICDPAHPGCLLLNVLAETADRDATLVARAQVYRDRLRSAFTNALANIDEPSAGQRCELVLAAVLGLNFAARGRADAAEMMALGNALKAQVWAWADAD